MKDYYYLISSLSVLSFDEKSDMSFNDLMSLYSRNMDREDWNNVLLIRSYIDLENVRRLLAKAPLDPRGNLNEKELNEALLNRETLPELLFDYLEKQESIQQQIAHFSKVFMEFYEQHLNEKSEFLRNYFRFEKEWRLVLSAYRAHQLKRSLEVELQYEDVTSPLVAEILAQKDRAEFEFPFEYRDLQDKVEAAGLSPLKQYENHLRFKFERIGQLVENASFSGDVLLAYMVQFMLLEERWDLSSEQGAGLLNRIVKEAL